jgi:hypothetical protein
LSKKLKLLGNDPKNSSNHTHLHGSIPQNALGNRTWIPKNE